MNPVPRQEEGEDALGLIAAWGRAAWRHLQHQDHLLDCLQTRQKTRRHCHSSVNDRQHVNTI